MRNIFIYSAVFILGFLFAIQAQARGFVSGFEDIPLMEGLKQIESDDIAFGNEETSYREAQLAAVRKKSLKDILSFYQETLPQLGWTLVQKSTESLKFTRENEALEISKIADTPLKISISLKNKN